MSLKRKASLSGPPLDETLTKVRKSLADLQPQDSASLQPNREAARTSTKPNQKVVDKAERWAELVFIVFTKENFQQDPSGPPGRSTTTGPLTNVQLRDAYCTNFNKEVGAEAAMKRYRNDKKKVYDAFPDHPRNISYAPKLGKPPKSKLTKPRNRHIDNEEDIGSSSANKTATLNAEGTVEGYHNSDFMAQNMQEAKGPQETHEIHAFEDNERNIDAGDLGRYIQSSWTIAENEHKHWVSIVLADSRERFMGACSVDAEALKSSQAYLELRQHTNVREIWLAGVSRLTLQRYVQCISPLRLSQLPQFDFALTPGELNPAAVVASCERIDWGFQATIDLYELATQLRDCHVRDVILDHWRAQLQGNRTYEVGLIEMRLLHDRLETDDPALQFWAQALQDLMPADDSAMDIDIVDSPSSTAFSVGNRLRDKSDERFHHQYHRCCLSDHKDGKCGHFQKHHTEASYTFDDFNYIARRLLLSEGWKEEDRQMQIVTAKLGLDLFDKYSLLL
jgi:hypothetical protein